jgi:hypothetical protein
MKRGESVERKDGRWEMGDGGWAGGKLRETRRDRMKDPSRAEQGGWVRGQCDKGITQPMGRFARPVARLCRVRAAGTGGEVPQYVDVRGQTLVG